jgi:hypothetical protein
MEGPLKMAPMGYNKIHKLCHFLKRGAKVAPFFEKVTLFMKIFIVYFSKLSLNN